jgi:hypothetical protein
MIFVRWYYRDGFYVGSHYRRRRKAERQSEAVLPYFA